MSLDSIVRYFGLGLCHQLTERSFVFGGVQFPVCARCTGIYIGFVFTIIALVWAYRHDQRAGKLAWPFVATAIFAVIAMGFDGLSSYMGFRETTNLLRLITGTLFGASLGAVVYMMLADTISKHRSNKPILNDGKSYVVWMTSMLCSVAFIYLVGPFLGFFGAILIVLAIMFTFGATSLTLIGLIPRFEHSVEGARGLIIPGVLAWVLGIGLIGVCTALRLLLDTLI